MTRAGIARTTVVSQSIRRCHGFHAGAEGSTTTLWPKVALLTIVCHVVAMPAAGDQRARLTIWSRLAARRRTASTVNR